MDDRPVFNIGNQHAGGNIYNIARDLNINKNSPAEDMLKIIKAIQYKFGELNIDEKYKVPIKTNLLNIKQELENENSDKGKIAEGIKKTNEILKEAKTASETLKDIAILVGKAAVWLGTTAAKLGWIF